MVIHEILLVQEYLLDDGEYTCSLNLDWTFDDVSERFTFLVKTGNRVSFEPLSKVVGIGSNMQELRDTIIFLRSSVMGANSCSRGGSPMGFSSTISVYLENSWRIVAILSSKKSAN